MSDTMIQKVAEKAQDKWVSPFRGTWSPSASGSKTSSVSSNSFGSKFKGKLTKLKDSYQVNRAASEVQTDAAEVAVSEEAAAEEAAEDFTPADGDEKEIASLAEEEVEANNGVADDTALVATEELHEDEQSAEDARETELGEEAIEQEKAVTEADPENPILLADLTTAKVQAIEAGVNAPAEEEEFKPKLVPLTKFDPHFKKLATKPKMLSRYQENLLIARKSMNNNKVVNTDRLVAVGGGAAMTEEQLYALARKRVQPTLEEVDKEVAKKHAIDAADKEQKHKVWVEKDSLKVKAELTKFQSQLAKKREELKGQHEVSKSVIEGKRDEAVKSHEAYVAKVNTLMETDVTDAENAETAAAEQHEKNLVRVQEDSENLKETKLAELQQVKAAQEQAKIDAAKYQEDGEALDAAAAEKEKELEEETTKLTAVNKDLQEVVDNKQAVEQRSLDAETEQKKYARNLAIATNEEKFVQGNVSTLKDHIHYLQRLITKRQAQLADLKTLKTDKLPQQKKEAQETRDAWEKSQAQIRSEEAAKQEKLRIQKEEEQKRLDAEKAEQAKRDAIEKAEAEKKAALEKEEAEKKAAEAEASEAAAFEAEQKKAAAAHQRELEKQEAELKAQKEKHEAQLLASKERQKQQKLELEQQKAEQRNLREQTKNMKELDKLHSKHSTWKRRLSLRSSGKKAAAGAAVGAGVAVAAGTGVAKDTASGVAKGTASGAASVTSAGAKAIGKVASNVSGASAGASASPGAGSTPGSGLASVQSIPTIKSSDVEVASAADTAVSNPFGDNKEAATIDGTVSPGATVDAGNETLQVDESAASAVPVETESLESPRVSTEPVFTEVVDSKQKLAPSVTGTTTSSIRPTNTQPSAISVDPSLHKSVASSYDEVVTYVPVTKEEYEAHVNDPDYFVVRD